MDTMSFKNVDGALEYVDKYFTSRKLANNIQLLGKILDIKENFSDDGSPAYLVQVSVLKGFFKPKLEKIIVLGAKHPELATELEKGDLVSWGASEIKHDIPFGYILFVHQLDLDISTGQFKHKTVKKDLNQILKNMPQDKVDQAIEYANSMWKYDIDHVYGIILSDCEFLVDGESYYINCNMRGRDITVCWNAKTNEWSSGIERKDLEGLSFSSPKLFEQVVFNLSTDENYAKKARLTECFKCGIAVGQTKTVHAKLKTDQLLELNFKSKEWNEILLGNTVSFLHPVRDGKNEDGSDFIFEYEVYISDWQVVIHYEDPGDSWVSYDIFEGNLKQLRGYYS